jgi:hypothetical protein
MKLLSLLGPIALLAFTGCATDTATDETEDDLRAQPVVIELAVKSNGKCVMRTTNPRVKYNRVVRLKNVGTKPLAALVELWDNFGGMPAPEGGDLKPGESISVKMSTKWWVLNDEPSSREWSTPISCKQGPWSSDEDMAEVGTLNAFR